MNARAVEEGVPRRIVTKVWLVTVVVSVAVRPDLLYSICRLPAAVGMSPLMRKISASAFRRSVLNVSAQIGRSKLTVMDS